MYTKIDLYFLYNSLSPVLVTVCLDINSGINLVCILPKFSCIHV